MEISSSTETARVPVTVLALKGDLDSTSFQDLTTQARVAFDGGARNMVLDLSQVPYMSSAGLRAINSIYKLLSSGDKADSAIEAEKGVAAGTYSSHHLKLVGPTPRVLEVLRMTGIDMFLSIYHTQKEALASF